ncbi:uncharacterized protein LOC124925901 [Impatiens glandulifera]|uniref:uncharacterized protein LOC124925901 n=1 Tax=Impatiens glandulifera TaxID=253017 RepID=UPI001FB08925|nr:uncharacterized protein LOC124925901 [Impatiens glandulifera]
MMISKEVTASQLSLFLLMATTTTIINPTILSYRRNSGISFTEKILPISSARNDLHNRLFSSPPRPTLSANCSGGASAEGEVVGGGGGLKVALSGLVNQEVEELLKKEENKELLDGLEKATLRVEIAKRELAEIEKQEIEARELRDYVNQLENRTMEIAECQRELLEARSMVEEAERSLNIGGTEINGDRNEERKESVKAALISASIGSLVSLPISLAQVNDISQLILPFGITFVSCALFGVTFRYAIRRDLDNFQLKTGTAAAFGFVKGLAMLESGPPLELDPGSLTSHAFSGAVLVSQSLLIFFFAAVGLDFFIKLGFLSPYPMGNHPSDANVR